MPLFLLLETLVLYPLRSSVWSTWSRSSFGFLFAFSFLPFASGWIMPETCLLSFFDHLARVPFLFHSEHQDWPPYPSVCLFGLLSLWFSVDWSSTELRIRRTSLFDWWLKPLWWLRVLPSSSVPFCSLEIDGGFFWGCHSMVSLQRCYMLTRSTSVAFAFSYSDVPWRSPQWWQQWCSTGYGWVSLAHFKPMGFFVYLWFFFHNLFPNEK